MSQEFPAAGLRSRRRRRRAARVNTQRQRSLFLEVLEDRRLLAAEPSVTLNVPEDPFIGTSPLVIEATFDNTSATLSDVGYGPFIDIVFPVNGADGNAGSGTDGISPISGATYLGQPLTTKQFTFPDDGLGTGCVEHPYAVDGTNTPLQVCGTAGDVLVVVQLPFGSFTPNQPPATIELQAELSELADLGVGLPFTARGGFQYGTDPLNNPSLPDPTILTTGSTGSDSSAWAESAITTPTVVRMTKTYVGPEDETATGPNFRRQYELTVSIAPGQTVTDLFVNDIFDNNIVVTAVDFPLATPASIPATPFGPENVSHLHGVLLGTVPSVVGSGGSDVVVTVDFYVPEFDANGDRIIPLDGTDPVPTENHAHSDGTWIPIDGRDDPQTFLAEPSPNDPAHTLDDKSIAIQKSVAVVGGGEAVPEVYLEYTLEFQISDYYTFGNLVVTDVISDGQDFLNSLGNPFAPPQFTVEDDRGGPFSGSFVLGTDVTHTTNLDGTETLVFDLSAAMRTAGSADGVLQGALATQLDDLTIPPAMPSPLPVGATGTITFQVLILDEYDVAPPSGFNKIAQGDSLGNTAEISGDVLDNDTPDPNAPIRTESDDTSAGVGLPIGEVSKSIYAVNGVYPPPAGFVLAPGDRLTYSLEYTLPFASFVNFSLEDFLPLPVFDVTNPTDAGSSSWTFNVEADPVDRVTPPLSGFVELGPDDTLYDYTLPFLPVAGYSSPPTLSTNPSANSLSFNYGSYNSSSNEPRTVQLLFTITASDRPFADGLFLTNIVRARESDSELTESVADAIVQFPLGQPALNITKGVVATDHPAPPAEFDPAPPVAPPLTMTAPGTSGFRFSNAVTSDYLSATPRPLDSNLANIDAGDLVTFSIVVENTGSSRKGAFDVQVRDTLPAGFAVPDSGLNLSVTDGTGTSIGFGELGGPDPSLHDLFENGIQLDDPGPTPDPIPDPWDGTDGGALDQYNATSGRNILVITYDLIAETSVQPRETIVNTVTLTGYAGDEGGPNHVAPSDQPSDEAEVTILEPAIDKTILETNQPHTTGRDVAIGEIVTYEVVVTVPEGTTDNAVLVDVLDSGLAFVDVVSIIPNSGGGATTDVTTSVGTFNNVATAAVFSSSGTGTTAPGRQLTLDFGTLTNANTDDTAVETLVITYRAVVLNSTNNNRGNQRNNLATWQWEDDFGPQSIQDGAPNVTIVEPTLFVFKDAVPLSGEAGDTITFTIEVRHVGVSNADAFDVVLTDLVPDDMTYVPGTLAWTGVGEEPDVLDDTTNPLAVRWAQFPDDSSSFLRFDVTLDPTVTPGEVITNEAEVRYTSLPGDITTPQSLHNDLSTERTGNPANPGGAANDYLYSDPASVTVFSPQANDKTIVATSEFITPGSDVAIGEIVRYRLRATVIEGTNPSYQFIDTLPAGLAIIDYGAGADPNAVRVSFVSDTPLGADADLLGANGGVVPPTFSMPSDRISVDTVGTQQRITFDFGTLINMDGDANEELVDLEFNVLVLNTVDTNAGDVKTNAFEVWTGGALVDTSEPVAVTIVEPLIDDLTKELVSSPPFDAGDLVTFRLTHSNTGTAPAFNIHVVDALDPAYFTLILPPVLTTECLGGVFFDNSAGNTIDVMFGCLDVGMVATIEYQAVLKTAVEPGQVLENRADLTYTSLPGPRGTETNPTGSTTPGDSGETDGKRDGSGGVNDYTDTDDETLTIQSPAFSKSLTATNQLHTDDLDVAIGEIVTYTAVITVPEGTLTGATVVDTPDAGLAIVDVISVVPNDPAALATSIGTFDDVRDNANALLPVNGNTLTLDFGTLTNTDTDNGAVETITITYRAVVLNTVPNARGGQLDNTAVLAWSRGVLTDWADPVTIVEPDLSVSKSPGDPQLGDAGDTITFTILVKHTGISDADAFDVQLVDLIDALPNKMTYVPGSLSVLDAGGATLAPGSPSDLGGNLSIIWSEFPRGATSTIAFDVTLDITVGPDETLTNTADVTWTSLPGNVTVPQASNPFSVERTGDPSGPGELGANTYADSDSGVVFTPGSPLLKSIVRTSEPTTGSGQHDPTITDLTIGETVTFVLIPSFIDGTYNNVVITDQLPFAPGVLEYVSASLAFAGADLTDGSGNSLVLPTPVLTDTNADGLADRIVFNFGTVVNGSDSRPESDNQDEMIIELTARVLDIPANQDGIELVNTGIFSVDGVIRGEDQVSVEIVEPQLTVTKDAAPLVVDGGDTVTFTITVAHTAASTADAFDVSVSDLIPAGLTYAGNLVALGGATPTVSLALPQVTFSWASIPRNAVPYTFTFDVTVDPSITPWTTFDNLAELEWSSLPGDDPDERPGDASDPAETITSSTTAQNPVKIVAATSEPATDGTDVAVGEIVRYRLQVELTEGTFPNLELVDTLPVGLVLLDEDQVRISWTSNVPMGLEADLVGASNNALPPTFVLPDSRIAINGQQIAFSLGDVVNNDHDVNVEFVTLEFNALVTNTAAVNNGDTKSNTFEVFVDDTSFGASSPVTVTVREPSITDVAKTVVGAAPVDAGDPVLYQVSYSNTGTAATATAFNVRLRDALDPSLFSSAFINTISLDGGASGITNDTAGTTLDLTIATIPVGGTVVVTYTGILSVNVQPGQTVPNVADVTYTSLPDGGTPLGSDNLTGSITPGGSGDGDGERDGSGGVNDYADSDNADVTLTGQPLFDKSLAGSSQVYTSDPLLTIGEQATYTLVLTIPEGTLPNVVIADALPAGLALVAFDSITPSSAAVTTDVAGGFAQILALANAGLTGNNASFAIDFGTLTNSNTDDLTTETLTITYRAVVSDVEANVDGETRTNDASLTWDDGTIDDDVTIEIVEPDLMIAKDTNVTVVDGGDTVTFTITVAHTAASTAWALDATVYDLLPDGLSYAGSVTAVSGPAPVVSVSGQDLAFFWAEFPLGDGPYSFSFDVTVDASITPWTTFENFADVEWSTLPGDDADERTYIVGDPADVITSSTTVDDPRKNMIVTSEAHTPDAPDTLVAIGEIVRYRLQAELTEGTFSNLVFVDTLPAGLSFLDAGQVRVSFVSDAPMGLAADLSGASNNAVPPSFVLPSMRIVGGPSGELRFELGTVTNNDNDANAELVVLEFNVLVDNTLGNTAGEIRTNKFRVLVDEVPFGEPQSVDVELVEPRIEDVSKQFVSMAGNQRTFEVSFSNTGTTTAFDTLVSDIIPAGASLNLASIAVTPGGGAAGISTAGSTPGVLQVTIGQLPVGGTVVVRYTLALTATAQAGLLNNVDVTYTSLPGPNGTTSNPTGSSTPGDPGDTDGERNGSGVDANDYVENDNETLGSLGDLVWYDMNADGVIDAGEPGLPNVDVTAVWAGADGIFGTVDDVTLATTTDAGGIYFFNALPPGPYRVTVDTGDVLPLIATYDLDGGLDSTTLVTLGIGQERDDVDFGYTDPSWIVGVKYRDDNGNGVRDAVEPPIAGVRVYLDANDNEALDAGELTTLTNASGNYSFGSLLPGTYVVRELRPDNTVQTAPGGDGAHTVVIVAPGSVLTDIDFGNQPVPPQIIDDGDPNFVIQGEWVRARCWLFYQSDAQYLCSETPGTGSNYVEWQFTGLAAGATYRVSTTWYPASALSQDAPYTVFGGAAPVTAVFNQTLSPSYYGDSFQDQGVWWTDISAAYTLTQTDTTLVVRLSDDHSGGCLLADAVRIIQETTPEISVLDGGADLTSGASVVDLGSTVPGTPLLRTFTVRNDGGTPLQLGTLTLPDGYSLDAALGLTTLAPGQTTSFSVRLDAMDIGTYAGAILLGNNDNDEAPFTFNIAGVVGSVYDPNPQPTAPAPVSSPAVPLMDVYDGTSLLVSGLSGIDWGTLAVGDTASRLLTVTNRGTADLLLGAIVVPSPGFSASPFGDDVLSPGESTTFTVSLDTSTAGTFVGDLILYDTSSQVIFTLGLNAAVEATSQLLDPLVIDNGRDVPGFEYSGMTYVTTSGYQRDINYMRGDNTGDYAQWTFTNLPAGSYQISTTWVRGTSRASNTPFTLTGVTGGPTTVLVNQKIAPDDLTWDGVAWEHLGTFEISGGTLTVRLTDNANGYVYADAVRVEQTSAAAASAPLPPAPEPEPEPEPIPEPPLAAPVVIDNGRDVPGFEYSGMTYVTTSGYQRDINYTRGDNSGDYAQWTFNSLPSGRYQVSTTWVRGTSRASNTPFTLTGVTGGPTTVLVDQKIAPNDLTWDGVAWEHLGTFQITGGTLTVRLTDNANGYVYADAIRVEQLSPLLGGAPEWPAGADRRSGPAEQQDLALSSVPGWPAGADRGSGSVELLTQAAIERWLPTAAAAQGLANVQVRVADLPPGMLGAAAVHSQTIWIDHNADGQDWFLDPTPWADEEFAPGLDEPLIAATPASRSGMDLLTVLAHELGHLLGHEDVDAPGHSGVMAFALPLGVRRLPQSAGGAVVDVATDAASGDASGSWPLADDRSVVSTGRPQSAAAPRADRGFVDLRAEQAAVWAPADENVARPTTVSRPASTTPEQRLDEALASVSDWLDPLDELVRLAESAR